MGKDLDEDNKEEIEQISEVPEEKFQEDAVKAVSPAEPEKVEATEDDKQAKQEQKETPAPEEGGGKQKEKQAEAVAAVEIAAVTKEIMKGEEESTPIEVKPAKAKKKPKKDKKAEKSPSPPSPAAAAAVAEEELEVQEVAAETQESLSKPTKSRKEKKSKAKKPVIVENEVPAPDDATTTAEEASVEMKPIKKEKTKKGKEKKSKSESDTQEETTKKGKKGKKRGQAAAAKGQGVSIKAFLKDYAAKQMEDDDEWTWESYTASTNSSEEEIVDKKKKRKGKGAGKGKKGKKKKEESTTEGDEVTEKKEKGKKEKKGKKGKTKGEEEADKPEAPVDIMAEINKMKALAEAQVHEEVTPEEIVAPKKKGKKGKKGAGAKKAAAEGDEGKGPKKKLSKKERAKLAAEQAEQARIQAELEAKRLEEEERIRQIEERKAAIEKEKRETAEQQLRAEQLTVSLDVINGIRNHNYKRALDDRAQHEWEQFLKCDGLPAPYDCGQMNTYLHLWDKTIESVSVDEAVAKLQQVLKLLEVLTDFIDDPIGAKQSEIDNWQWIHRLFREYLQKNLDTAVYRILRDVDENMHRIDLPTADFRRKEDNFALCLWVAVRLPRGEPKPRKPPPPRVDIDFTEMNMQVLFPQGVTCYCMVIRAMYVKYDHLSDLSTSSQKPTVPEQYGFDLYKSTLEEWRSKLYYKYLNHPKPEPKTPSPDSGDETKQEKVIEDVEVVDREAGIIPIVPYTKLEPTASTYVIAEEDQMYAEIRQGLITEVAEYVINLRRYLIVGGTYYFELFHTLPQPKDVVIYDISVTRLLTPKCLSEVPFHITYNAPPPIDPLAKRDPEELEEEMRKQEAELDRLISITLILPSHVMWLDVPKVCFWDKEKLVWTTEDVHDLKHIEEKGYITFRTGRFGCFTLAMNRYANLPYQAWEIRPEVDGTVTLQITAAILLIEFSIKENLISIIQIQNSPNNALQELIGVYVKLPKLIRMLQEGGVDMFPEFDAFCYVDATCEKHWPLERHTYYTMALLSACYNFTWSRWNLLAGRRNIVMQMREYKPEKTRQALHSMLHLNPLKANLVDCTEVSQAFSEEPIEGMHFYSDLYQLMKGTSGIATRTKVQNTSPELIGAVADLLIATRVLSFS